MPTGLDVGCLLTVPKDCWCVVVYLVGGCLLLWFAGYGWYWWVVCFAGFPGLGGWGCWFLVRGLFGVLVWWFGLILSVLGMALL